MEQKYCQYLLEARVNGITIQIHLRNSFQLILTRVVLIFACFYFYSKTSAVMYLFAGGILLGALAQDIGWFWKISHGWHITEKFIDWEKVKAAVTQTAK